VLRKLVPEVLQIQFGNPVTGTTRFDVCVYDDALRLVGALTVDRAGQSCGSTSRLCWRAISTRGYRYVDRDGAADGVRSMLAVGGSAGRGKIVVKARNDGRRGQFTMPLGMTAALEGTQSVTVQTVASDGACFGGTLTNIRSAGPTSFRAQ
jgi:hypothetical protein